jgi:hypothetical protein
LAETRSTEKAIEIRVAPGGFFVGDGGGINAHPEGVRHGPRCFRESEIRALAAWFFDQDAPTQELICMRQESLGQWIAGGWGDGGGRHAVMSFE